MAKKGIHPAYNDITVVLTDGSKFKTKSCCKEKVIKLDVDPLNHPAWREEGGRFVNLRNDQVSKFNRKFGNLNFGKLKLRKKWKKRKKRNRKRKRKNNQI